MRSLLHTTAIRRNVLFLFVFTILSLIGLLKLISYNNEKRKAGEAELEQGYAVVQNIGRIRSSVAETESFIQSFMLSGDQQWKNLLSAAQGRILETLKETAALETDPLQQHKFSLIRQAIEQKIAFQQTVINAGSITPGLTAAMGFHGLNKRLTQRIESPLNLLSERQQQLLQRKADRIGSAATHARFITIFLAVFLYMLILAALWKLRNQVQPGPAAKMNDEEGPALEYIGHNRASTADQPGFRGVFPIHDIKDDRIRRQEGIGLVRVLWTKAELEESFGYLAAKMSRSAYHGQMAAQENAMAALEEEGPIPGWKAAGLPEELSLGFNKGNDHILGQAVNANYYQAGPVYNRQQHAYHPGGASIYRVLPAPGIADNVFPRFPGQGSPGFDLADFVKEMLQPFQAQADEKNIRLLHMIDPAVPNFLSGDAKKLRNILHSMVENAMRFTSKGYIQLTITALNIKETHAELAFSVADTGKGLDAEQLHDLNHGTGSKVPALYHAKKLAESQQSQLMIHSTEEDGTVCCLLGCYRFDGR